MAFAQVDYCQHKPRGRSPGGDLNLGVYVCLAGQDTDPSKAPGLHPILRLVGALRTRSQCADRSALSWADGRWVVSIRITAVRLSDGNDHEHIVRLWWVNPADSKTGDNSRAEIVNWIEHEGGKAYVEDARGHRQDVLVVTPHVGAKYLRTRADGVWTNNLLALPRR